MRYENWDVLLFPEDSKIPLQEFKTQCFVIDDQESPYLYSPALNLGRSYYPVQGNLGRLPVLTTFIPSIAPGTPFRVSIHSWERPGPSRLMETLLHPDDALLFEARVFIDGECVAGSVFSQRTTWPHVIVIDKRGNQDDLRFPPFHYEILEQRHWDAGDPYGRIRVVISEGFARPHRSPPFERVKELIAFAFQHAPLPVLECSNIAWPNPSMWDREPRLFKYASASCKGDMKDPEDAHTHSPTRHGIQLHPPTTSQPTQTAGRFAWDYRNYQAPRPSPWQDNPPQPRWGPTESDPFLDPYYCEPTARHRGARPSAEDVAMPDYSSSSTSGSRVMSNMTGASYVHSKHPSQEAYAQVIDALHPRKSQSGSIPTPTVTGSQPTTTKPSAAAEARSASYAKSSSRTTAMKEMARSETREASGFSTRSTLSENGSDEVVSNGLHTSPNISLMSRKERMSQGRKENESTLESPRRESDRLSPSTRRTSRNSKTSPGPKGSLSGGPVGGESGTTVKGPILVSSAQILSEAQGLVGPADHGELLGAKTQLSSSVVEVAEVD
ncbi:predicted protein [Aspergillus terreus NIH2624]|uniref:Uncharacterized protein n=1 Tax=Aspergillus terreus (strain NIH 2624 / FGSC A1156) TaxID=341663 RepID=Q0CWS8_ASPTN|nr:uncharacterized protein ATEG_01856 [Aspergillus terreus NIH2624]EAU38613.1 predicted protein [Aspergillus terreus NIH2624]